jgi:single-stranded-DNA-specific exonuclease
MRALPLLLLATVAILIAHLLDPLAFRYIRVESVNSQDWGRFLRVLGFLPLWLVAGLALMLEDGDRGRRLVRGRGGLLIAGGGHAMAAGLTLPSGGFESFGAFICERLAQDVEKARGDRALLLDALLAPGGVAGGLCDALDAAGPYGAGWPNPRVAAGPVRLIKTGIVGDGHVRGIGAGEDGKSFKWIAFRSASAPLGQALLASAPDTRWWLAGTIKRDEWNGGNAAEMHLEDAALA